MADEGMEMKAQDLTGACNPTSVANIAHIAVHSKYKEEREVARRIYDHMMKNLPRDNFFPDWVWDGYRAHGFLENVGAFTVGGVLGFAGVWAVKRGFYFLSDLF